MPPTTRGRAAAAVRPTSTKAKQPSTKNSAGRKIVTTKVKKDTTPKQKVASKVEEAVTPKTKRTVVKTQGPRDRTDLWSPTPEQRKKTKMTDAEAVAFLDSIVGAIDSSGPLPNNAGLSGRRTSGGRKHSAPSSVTFGRPSTDDGAVSGPDAAMAALERTFGPPKRVYQDAAFVDDKAYTGKASRHQRSLQAERLAAHELGLHRSAQKQASLKVMARGLSNSLINAQQNLARFLHVLSAIDE